MGIPGNERVDEIADTLARQGEIELYRGPLDELRRGDSGSAGGYHSAETIGIVDVARQVEGGADMRT